MSIRLNEREVNNIYMIPNFRPYAGITALKTFLNRHKGRFQIGIIRHFPPKCRFWGGLL